MNIKTLVKDYDFLVNVDSSQDVEDQTKTMFAQIKGYRDYLCREEAKSINDVLKIEYAYIISSLNNRQKIWAYDYMTFPRRIGEVWESFCKAPFYNADLPIRLYKPPLFDSIKAQLKLPKHVWDIVGDVNLKQDIHFYSKKTLHVIDFKSSFNSNEKGNVQRLKTIGAVYKMWKPRSKLYVFMRQGGENNQYLEHLEPYWNVLCGPEAYDRIKDMTAVDLRRWISRNVRFKEHLSPALYSSLKKQNLLKYLEW